MNDKINDLPANPYALSALSDEEQLGKPDSSGPVFELCARDLIAPKLVRLWADLMRFDDNCSQDRRWRANRIAAEMEAWQKNRGMIP